MRFARTALLYIALVAVALAQATWSAGTSYNSGAKVQLNNHLYTAIQASKGANPAQRRDVWQDNGIISPGPAGPGKGCGNAATPGQVPVATSSGVNPDCNWQTPSATGAYSGPTTQTDQSANRSPGNLYTNSGPSAMWVTVTFAGTTTNDFVQMQVGPGGSPVTIISFTQIPFGSSANNLVMSFVVPAGFSYQFQVLGSPAVSAWVEWQ